MELREVRLRTHGLVLENLLISKEKVPAASVSSAPNTQHVQETVTHTHMLPPNTDALSAVDPTLEMVSGMLKSFPPCSLKPQGPGPGSDTV